LRLQADGDYAQQDCHLPIASTDRQKKSVAQECIAVHSRKDVVVDRQEAFKLVMRPEEPRNLLCLYIQCVRRSLTAVCCQHAFLLTTCILAGAGKQWRSNPAPDGATASILGQRKKVLVTQASQIVLCSSTTYLQLASLEDDFLTCGTHKQYTLKSIREFITKADIFQSVIKVITPNIRQIHDNQLCAL